MNPWGALIGAFAGGIKAQNEEKMKHKEREIEALKTRWAAFTGQGFGKNVAQVDHMGRVMQGSMAGGMMGMGGDQGLSQPQGGGQTGNVAQSGQSNNYQMMHQDEPAYMNGGQYNKYSSMA